MDREGRIAVFQDTMARFQRERALWNRTLMMQQGEKLYFDRYKAAVRTVKAFTPDISVVKNTTFDCARRAQRNGVQKTAVLNFANAYHPGGGVASGASAQEESLCRCSNLYLGLTMPYIQRHYYQWNRRNTGDMGTDNIIYSPGVMVIRDDDYGLLSPDEFFQTDVITCAAPYYDADKRRPVSREKLETVFYERWKNILEVAMGNGVENLVLGAFGCGAFHNPPELVARQLAKLLYDEGYGNYFWRVLIAVKPGKGTIDSKEENYSVFRRVFGEYSRR